MPNLNLNFLWVRVTRPGQGSVEHDVARNRRLGLVIKGLVEFAYNRSIEF